MKSSTNWNLDSIIYPKYVTAEYIVRYVRCHENTIGSNVETLYRLVNNRVESTGICDPAVVSDP